MCIRVVMGIESDTDRDWWDPGGAHAGRADVAGDLGGGRERIYRIYLGFDGVLYGARAAARCVRLDAAALCYVMLHHAALCHALIAGLRPHHRSVDHLYRSCSTCGSQPEKEA